MSMDMKEAPIESRRDGFLLSTDKGRLQVDVIHHYLSSESYWAAGITRNIVEKAIAHSLCMGLYLDEKQVGFARVVTDQATFAYLADVFILPDYRGKGLARWMIATLQDHPALQGLRRWMLVTRDAHRLYESCGWSALDETQAQRTMLRLFPDIYRKNA